MRHIKTTATLLIVAFLVGCGTLYTTTVTVTQVVDAGMKDWAAASVAGKTTPAIDATVMKAHEKYRAAAAAAQTALIAYKASGSQDQYLAALTAVRAAASQIFDLITPFIPTAKAQDLNAKLSKATSL